MRTIILITCVFLGLFCCQSTRNDRSLSTGDLEMLEYLDSVGRLNPDSMTLALITSIDTTYIQKGMNKELLPNELEKLIHYVKEGSIELEFAKEIFPNLKYNDTQIIIKDQDSLLLVSYFDLSSDEEQFEKFAITIGESSLSWENDIYFIENSQIIYFLHSFHRYGLDIKSFEDQNKTVVYFRENFGSGTGIWWNQFRFFSINEGVMQPILSEMANVNLSGWSYRQFTVESKILSQSPLKIQFEYQTTLPNQESQPTDLINDSTVVTYKWNNDSKLEADFSKSTLSRNKLVGYYLGNSDLLFVNTHIELFRKYLSSSDMKSRAAVKSYLMNLKATSKE